MKKYPVSVVVIARDEENEIKGCLKSILSADPDEVIVVIDKRTIDSTFEISKGFTKKVYLIDGVRGKLRNFGWEKSRNEIVCYVDADMRLPDDYLEKILPMFINNDDTAAMGAAWLPLGPALCGKLEWILWDNAKIFGTGGGFYRKSILKSVDGFNDELESGEDSDLSSRLKKNGWKLKFIETPKAYHRFAQKWKVLFHKWRYGGRKFHIKVLILFFASPIRAPLIALKYKCWHILWFYPLRWFYLAFFSGKKEYNPIK